MVLRRGKRFNICTNRTLKYQHEAPGRGSSRGFTGQCVIAKEMRNIPDYGQSPVGKKVLEDYSKMFDDGGLEANEDLAYNRHRPLMYSMNKKRRWELPYLLKQNINNDDCHKDKDYRVLMSEKCFTSEELDHHLYRRNRSYLSNCKAVHDSKAKSHKSRFCKKKYSFAHDLRGETKMDRRAQRQLRRRERARTGIRMKIDDKTGDQETGETETVGMPELRYEVCHPRPKNQYSWHAEKKHKRSEDIYSYYYDYEADKVQFRNNGNHWKPSVLRSRCYDLVEDIDAFGNACEGDCNMDDIPDEENLSCIGMPVMNAQATDSDVEDGYIVSTRNSPTLGDFVLSSVDSKSQHDCDMKTGHCNQGRSKNPGPDCKHLNTYRRYGKGCAIYESASNFEDAKDTKGALMVSSRNSDSGFESDGSSLDADMKTPTPATEDDLTLSWVNTSRIILDSVTPKELRQDFGSLYSEGNSLPRRFRIKVRARDVSAVFENDKNESDLEEESFLKFRVRLAGVTSPTCNQLKIRLSDAKTDIRRVSDVMKYVDEVLAEHWTVESDLRNETPPPKEPRLTHGLLQSMMGWQFDCHTVKEVNRLMDEAEEETAKSEVHCEESSLWDLHSVAALQSLKDDPFCGICYIDLAPSSGDKERGSALIICGHWFCDDCWTRHLSNRVQMADNNIMCPAFQCKSPVDAATVLSLLPDSLTRIYCNHLHDNRISSLPTLQWCPAPKCGKLVRIHAFENGSSTVIGVPMFCECGQIWCSDCKEGAHWPASCKQAANHTKNVRESGVDEKSSIRSVEVKRCRECRNPIEKNGGCPHMVCACGFSFCWTCLYSYSEHSYSASWEFVCPGSPLDEEIMFLSGKKSHTVLLGELALVNRKNSNSAAILKHYTAAVSLARKLFSYTDYTPRPSDFTLPSSPQPWFLDQMSKFASWVGVSSAKQSRFHSISRLTHEIAVFCVEVPYLLEYLSILIGQSPRKLMVGKSGWIYMIDRLMFTSGRVEVLLHSHHSCMNLPETMDNMSTLMLYGKESLKVISKTLPVLHRRMAVKSQRSRGTNAVTREKTKAV